MTGRFASSVHYRAYIVQVETSKKRLVDEESLGRYDVARKKIIEDLDALGIEQSNKLVVVEISVQTAGQSNVSTSRKTAIDNAGGAQA